MQCATGIDLYSYFFDMKAIQNVSCEMFQVALKNPENDNGSGYANFVKYARFLCVTTTNYKDCNYTLFKNAFCRTAPDVVLAVAHKIREKKGLELFHLAMLGVSTTATAFITGKVIERRWPVTSKILKVVSIFSLVITVSFTIAHSLV